MTGRAVVGTNVAGASVVGIGIIGASVVGADVGSGSTTSVTCSMYVKLRLTTFLRYVLLNSSSVGASVFSIVPTSQKHCSESTKADLALTEIFWRRRPASFVKILVPLGHPLQEKTRRNLAKKLEKLKASDCSFLIESVGLTPTSSTEVIFLKNSSHRSRESSM
jgi:hypothetical protein